MEQVFQKQTMTAQEVGSYLGLSKMSVYRLFQEPGFPSFRVGSRIMVTKAAFEKWLNEKQGRKQA